MKPLIQLVYASCPALSFREHTITELLKQARLANKKRNLTGILVHVDQLFFQIIEGEPGMVDAVYATIERDTRHTRVRQIVRQPVAERSFAASAMDFCTMDPVEMGHIVGETDDFDAATAIELIDICGAKLLLGALAQRRSEFNQRQLPIAMSRTG